ncbi:MAG: fumarate hydratase [Oscillospiraceae bacterium]|nr:fumarate hydratase [Oscillospiraceae bacterium]
MSTVELVKQTLVKAGTSFSEGKIRAYQRAIAEEENEHSKWVLESILENAIVADKNHSPLCDDSGIPHLFLEIGGNRTLSAELIADIEEGVRQGLKEMPGRPMGILGDDKQRLDQSAGLDPRSEGVEPSPLLIKRVEGDVLRLHIIMQGGGPAIRGITYRVFHRHSLQTVIDEIVARASEGVAQLGCTPCTVAIGIGRSQFEAASLMMEAQVYGDYDRQSDLEEEITRRINETDVGPLGLHGKHSVLATFMKVGPQRASGVRIVSIRPCCCFEPRIASVDL